jgi:hypothetical protein
MATLLLLQPTRCGMPTVTLEAAEIPPAIVITDGKTRQGFPYMFGGVSSNEREVMDERVKGYNLKLVFAAKEGAFVSNVNVMIATTQRAEIVSLNIDGPWLFIRLPAGEYFVRATFRGEAKEVQRLRVTADKLKQQVFVWDVRDAVY